MKITYGHIFGHKSLRKANEEFLLLVSVLQLDIEKSADRAVKESIKTALLAFWYSWQEQPRSLDSLFFSQSAMLGCFNLEWVLKFFLGC